MRFAEACVVFTSPGGVERSRAATKFAGAVEERES
jgi:hypothetical protein